MQLIELKNPTQSELQEFVKTYADNKYRIKFFFVDKSSDIPEIQRMFADALHVYDCVWIATKELNRTEVLINIIHEFCHMIIATPQERKGINWHLITSNNMELHENDRTSNDVEQDVVDLGRMFIEQVYPNNTDLLNSYDKYLSTNLEDGIAFYDNDLITLFELVRRQNV